MEEYKLEKVLWTIEDFSLMSWKECTIYAVAFPPANTNQLWLDIDYIFEWAKPEVPEKNFKFWIAPSTLVFENIHKVKFDFDDFNGIRIDSIEREGPFVPPNAAAIEINEEWEWTVACHSGNIQLRSIGFKQFVRSKPILHSKIMLGRDAETEYSFSKKFRTG